MRRTKEDAEETRKKLLEAAERVFGKKGYAATRLSDIADEANVTRGAIYHHFGNKMDLFICLSKERVDPYLKIVDGIFESDLSSKEKIKKIFTEIIERAMRDIHFLTKQRFEFLRDFELIDSDDIHEYMQKRGNPYREGLVALLKQGQQTGDIRQDVSPELVAFNIEVYLKGLISVIIMDKDMRIIENQSEELLEALLKGV